MNEHPDTSDVSREQQDTAALLLRLLGKAIADRYLDLCRLAAGAFDLRVARPVAAHALRELDSLIRKILEVPLDANAPEQPSDQEQEQKARAALAELGFDEAAIERAIKGLKPRLNHKNQIRNIVARLGLAPDSDVAKLWISVTDSSGKAHQRSFHHALKVDEEFRSQFQRPFDAVIRAVAVALQGRYASFMQRVEELASMPDRAKAVALFASEIPGAVPLQWHFYRQLQTGDWLPHLAEARLLGEPLAGADEDASKGFRSRQWPAGDYLRRMAQSTDAVTRKRVAEALRNVALSKHPDIQQDGLEIIAALPPNEAAELADLAVTWLGRDARFSFLQAPHKLVHNLAEGKQPVAAQKVARALLQVWDDNGHIATLYGRHMYEHHLPSIMRVLTQACGEDALRLLTELLREAAIVSGKIRYSHHSSRPITDETMANSDIFEALLAAVRQSAEMLIQEDAGRMRSVIDILTGDPAKFFIRLAMHVLSRDPAAAPDLADAYLLDPELVEATWCRDEYGTLALAWFPSLTPEKQQSVLRVVDAVPEKYLAAWKASFEEQTKVPPNAGDEQKFRSATLRDILWKWRGVLPQELQDRLDRIANELGDPDSWMRRLFPAEESPLTGGDLSASPIDEVAAFLKSWKPTDEARRQTVTALAQELYNAVSNDPKSFAENADQFVGVRPIYVRRVMEALENAARNNREFDWAKVLKLIEFTTGQFHQTIDPSTLADGDDRDWTWACKAASDLLGAGLGRGAGAIGFEHAPLVRSMVFTVVGIAPKQPEAKNFEKQFHRDPYSAAQATLRGKALELAILFMFWLTKDSSTTLGASPREALAQLPAVRALLESELADRSASGRVPRAIMGRYLKYLFYFGEGWLAPRMGDLFPASDESLRRAAWLSYLGFGQGPVNELVPYLHQCYAEAIEGWSRDNGEPDRDFRQNSLADHVVILHLWGGLPDDLLELFWRKGSLRMRQHAIWFLGTQLGVPDLPEEMRARGFSYWERRLAEAECSADLDFFRAELGGIGQWSLREQIDDLWLSDQLLAILKAGFVPTDAFSVVEWLQNLSSRHLDRAVEVLTLLLMNPHVDRWAYMTQRDPIRAVLRDGLARGTEQTVGRAQEAINFLSSIGETSYLDLLRPSAA